MMQASRKQQDIAAHSLSCIASLLFLTTTSIVCTVLDDIVPQNLNLGSYYQGKSPAKAAGFKFSFLAV